jgi:hypothetical protein
LSTHSTIIAKVVIGAGPSIKTKALITVEEIVVYSSRFDEYHPHNISGQFLKRHQQTPLQRDFHKILHPPFAPLFLISLTTFRYHGTPALTNTAKYRQHSLSTLCADTKTAAVTIAPITFKRIVVQTSRLKKYQPHDIGRQVFKRRHRPSRDFHNIFHLLACFIRTRISATAFCYNVAPLSTNTPERKQHSLSTTAPCTDSYITIRKTNTLITIIIVQTSRLKKYHPHDISRQILKRSDHFYFE